MCKSARTSRSTFCAIIIGPHSHTTRVKVFVGEVSVNFSG
jgi:hypothetical protein